VLKRGIYNISEEDFDELLLNIDDKQKFEISGFCSRLEKSDALFY